MVSQWTWAVPTLLEATATSSVLHLLQHALLFYSGLLLWWVIIDPLGHRLHQGHDAAGALRRNWPASSPMIKSLR